MYNENKCYKGGNRLEFVVLLQRYILQYLVKWEYKREEQTECVTTNDNLQHLCKREGFIAMQWGNVEVSWTSSSRFCVSCRIGNDSNRK